MLEHVHARSRFGRSVLNAMPACLEDTGRRLPSES